MKTNIFIPNKINVGYQGRSDTYTGKLAYVIYFDEKGKLRKEKSWNSWRDQNIPNNEFDNTPTDGFILNKRAGGYKSGWDYRQAHCRVYDPRGFEFEITIDNLLYILDFVDCLKGKELQGKFIYAWDGTELILMPIDSPDYKEIVSFTSKVNKSNIKVKDLVIGRTYLGKDNESYIYMGKYDYYGTGYRYYDNDGKIVETKYDSEIPSKNYNNKVDYQYTNIYYGKYMWFARKWNYEEKNGYEFEQYKSLPKKILECIDENIDKDYNEILNKMRMTPKFSPQDDSKTKAVPYTFSEFEAILKYSMNDAYSNLYYYGIYADNGFPYSLRYDKDKKLWKVEIRLNPNYILRDDGIREGTDEVAHRKDFVKRFNASPVLASSGSYWSKPYYEYQVNAFSEEELFKRLKPCYIERYLKNGALYSKEGYLIPKKVVK